MFRKNLALWLALLFSFLFIILAFVQFGPIESLELTTYDWRMRRRAAGPETKTDIVLVDIDNDSITNLGRWPWPRSRLAKVVDRLKDHGAAFIGLQILLPEPEIGEGLELVESLKKDFTSQFAWRGDPAAEGFLKKLTEAMNELNHDKKLTESITKADNVVLPVFFDMGRFSQSDVMGIPEYIRKSGLVQVQGSVLGVMYPARKITAPIEPFSEAAIGLGHLNMPTDTDGAVRREILLVNYKGLAFPSYSLRLALLAQGIPQDTVRVLSMEEGQAGLQVGQQLVPTNPNLDLYITFTHPKAYNRVSFYDVLNDKVSKAAFKDKIVLIGVSATGIDIPKVTPIDNQMPTAMLVANVMQNLLEGGFIVRTGMMDLIELAILVLIGAFLSILLPRLRARAGAIASIALLVVVIGSGIYLFIGMGIWFKMTYPVLLIILGYAAVTTSRYFVTEVMKDKVEGESAEVNRMLGLSFQSQGQLDMAFDKLRRVPVDEGMKDILYNLALDYERKRMFNKAVSVYEYIREHDGEYRDISAKIKKLNVASESLIFGLGAKGQQAEDGSLVLDEDTKPTLGRYEITGELGKGAMGIVYSGQDPQIGREMAIKTIRFTDEYEEEEAEKIKDQFFAEAKTAGMLSHPNIVTIYDAGTDHDLSYIAMEFLEGYDLKEHARKENLLPIRDVVRIVAEVAEALGYAHSKGVVHRDIKPANIMYLKNGTPKVTDFGIARAMASSKTKTGVVKGTPFYMSPEQITGKKVDGRSDIFSLGVVLYELLTGVQPFRAEDLTGLIYKITSDEPDPITNHNRKVPKALGQIIDKSLVKDREKRYQKAEQMSEHLKLIGRKMDELAARKQQGRK